MNGRSCSMSLHRTSGTPQGPGMVSGQHIPPIRAHSGTPGPTSCGSTASPAIGSLGNSLHLKMPSGGGMAPQSNMAESPLHLPALSPRRQVLTNGKPRYQVTQAGGMSGPHTLKPKQQEFGNPFPPNPGKGALGFGPQCKSIGKGSCNNLVVTSSPMMVQRLGPNSPPASQVSTACNQISPSLQRAMNAANLNIPPSDTRSLISRESLASTTLSLTDSQSALSVKQEWSHGYRALPSLSSSHSSQNGIDLGDLLSLPPGTAVSSNSVSNSLPSYLFGMENSHSPYPSPRHSSARSHSARSKKRALSLSPLSDGIGIDFNTIIRTSPTSLVAYINGSRASPASMSPQPEVYGHFLGVRGSCIPQPCSVPSSQKGLRVAGGGLALPAYGEDSVLEYERMQQLEHGTLQPGLVNNMVVQHGLPNPDGQSASLLKTERLDDFPGTALDLPPAPPPLPPLPPPPQGPPPPYHSHPHLHHQELVPRAQPLALPQAALEEDGEMDDVGGKHSCRWIDCSALYDQQEELVRHIEKVHIDQRKGEDFTCFWAGCPRRYKPFNARYKLLIHMRVHSGEKPNKCTVERIVDKRKNKKGKWEYLIRWKGYGSTEDTWEPEHHLLHCEEFIDEFNGLHVSKDKRIKSGKQTSASKLLRDGRGPSVEKLSHRPSESGKSKGTSHKRKRINPSLSKPKKGYSGKPPAGGDRATKTVSYRTTPSGLQIMPLKKAQNGMENGDAGSEKDERHFGNGSHQPGLDLNDVGEQDLTECGVNHGALAENGLGSALTNGGLNLHSPVKRKLEAEKDYVFDKRLRYSVRQNESNCRFRDIVVRKEEGFTHILLSSQTSDNNALTPEIMKEVRRALCNAATDDSKLLLLSAVGSVFCSGLDYSYLIGRLSSDRRKESTRIAEAIRDFVKAFIQFKKPIVVAINGPALGLGASILPLCDIVWASEKAWFQTPYATIRLTPAGCSSYTFPQILGVALANEMLFCGRKLTAQEACSRGLVSQVFWPTTFSQEVMLRVKEMASCSAVVLEESKCLVRSFLKSVLEDVNEKECLMLKQLWSSSKGLDSLFSYLQDKIYEV